MSSETRTSIRASERRRQRVVVAGVAGVAVLTAGAIAYWPGGSSHAGASIASSLGLPGTASSGTPTDQAWAPTSASTTPKTGLLLGDDPNSGTSRGAARTPLAPSAVPSSAASSSAPSTTANQASGRAQSGTPAPAGSPAATTVPVLPSISVPRPIIGHGTASARQTATPTATPTGTSTSSSTPSTTPTTPTSTTTATPLAPTVSVSVGATATPTPTATQPRQGCTLLVLC